MAVAKRKGRQKPMKLEQRKVQGLEWGPQVKQTALLASPIYIRQAQGEEKKKKKKNKHKKRSQNWGRGLALFVSFGSPRPHSLRMYFPLLSK